MKKFNLTIVVTILMLSFGCQKEIKSTSESTAPNSSTEESGIVMKCNPSTPSLEWYDDGGTVYLTSYKTNSVPQGGPNSYGTIAYNQVNGTPDISILTDFFDEIEYGTNQDVINFITANSNTLKNYIDECILSLTKSGDFTLQMHLYQNIGGGGQLEFLKVMEPNQVDILFVIPILLS